MAAPASPAPVSGPGALAKRTDRQPIATLPDAQYGEAQNYKQIQQGAPIPRIAPPSGGSMSPPAGGGQPAPPQLTPIGAPTQRPGEPVTHGSPLGPGAGPEALGNLSAPVSTQYTSARDAIAAMAASPNASPQIKSIAAALGRGY